MSNLLRDRSAALEKTEELLADINKKIKDATAESNEGSKVATIKSAIAVLKRELTEMDQKREILSWELRNHILRQKGKGKDDYLEINYF